MSKMIFVSIGINEADSDKNMKLEFQSCQLDGPMRGMWRHDELTKLDDNLLFC